MMEGATSYDRYDATRAADYGLSADNTGGQNAEALAEAIEDASYGSCLRIPPGLLHINMHALPGLGAVVIDKSLSVVGAGRGLTVLKAEGFVEGTYDVSAPATVIKPNDNNHALLQVKAGEHRVVFTDMTLDAPHPSDITLDLNFCWALWCGGGGSVHLERVDALLWNQTSKCSPEFPKYPGVGTHFSATDCRFSFRASSGPLHIAGTDATKDSIRLTRCILEYDDSGSPTLAAQPTSNGAYPCLYANTGVSIEATNCWFKSAGRGRGFSSAAAGWLHYGGGYFKDQNNVALYARCTDCLFDTDIPQIQMRNAPGVTTEVSRTRFRTGAGNTAIEVAGPIRLEDCKLEQRGGGYGIVSRGDFPLYARGCTIGTPDLGDGYTLPIYRQKSDSTAEWLFEHCELNDMHEGGASQLCDAGRTTFNECDFRAKTGTYTVSLMQGTAAFNRCRVRSPKQLYVDGWCGDSTLELNGNRWSVSASPEINSPGKNRITINGSDNQFYETLPGVGEGFTIVGTSGIENLSGSLQPRMTLGAYSYDSGVLTLNYGHGLYRWNEVKQTVKTILMQGSNGAGTVEDHMRYCSAHFYLCVEQDVTFEDGDNIITPSGGPLTVKAGNVLQLWSLGGQCHIVLGASA